MSSVHDVEREVEDRFARDFNYLPLRVVERLADDTLWQSARLRRVGRTVVPDVGTLFEARDAYLAAWIEAHVDALYEIGIGVIAGLDDLQAMLFIAGAGYNFYSEHWVPLYRKLLDRSGSY